MRYLILTLILAIPIFSFGQYQCNWNSLNCGNGNMTSTNFQAQTSAIQTAIGSLTSSNFLAVLGFWYPGIGTGIMEDKESEITNINPLITKLYSAKPNPFKTRNAIRFSLPAECKVNLLIYDISGRLVRTLVDENKLSGIYTVNWDSRNDRNQTVSAGIYFYKFQTPNYTETKKLLLIE